MASSSPIRSFVNPLRKFNMSADVSNHPSGSSYSQNTTSPHLLGATRLHFAPRDNSTLPCPNERTNPNRNTAPNAALSRTSFTSSPDQTGCSTSQDPLRARHIDSALHQTAVPGSISGSSDHTPTSSLSWIQSPRDIGYEIPLRILQALPSSPIWCRPRCGKTQCNCTIFSLQEAVINTPEHNTPEHLYKELDSIRPTSSLDRNRLLVLRSELIRLGREREHTYSKAAKACQKEAVKGCWMGSMHIEFPCLSLELVKGLGDAVPWHLLYAFFTEVCFYMHTQYGDDQAWPSAAVRAGLVHVLHKYRVTYSLPL